jgi:hypothetical protein
MCDCFLLASDVRTMNIILSPFYDGIIDIRVRLDVSMAPGSAKNRKSEEKWHGWPTKGHAR